MKHTLLWILLCLSLSLGLSAQDITPQDSVAIVQAHWQDTPLSTGLTLRHASFTQLYGGPQQVYILQINTRKHPLRVCEHQGRELTTQKAQAARAVGAINGTFFDMDSTKRSICYTAVEGRVTDYTRDDIGLLSDGAVVIRRHKVQIIPWKVSEERNYKLGKKDVMVCGPFMLSKGREVDLGPNPGTHIPKPNPRSGIWVCGKHTVCLVVVDGRRKDIASGITVPQFAHLSRLMGAREALNLDGGGSSVLWTAAQGIANQPSDGHERTVSNSILVK